MKYILIPLGKAISILWRTGTVVFLSIVIYIWSFFKLLWSFNISNFITDVSWECVSTDIINERTSLDAAEKLLGYNKEVDSVKDYILNGVIETKTRYIS